MTNQIIDLAEQLQIQANNHASEVMQKSDKVSYQDCINTWVYLKLAELEIELLKLKQQKSEQ